MDRGAWWATVHGVAKSQTRLSDFTSLHFTFHPSAKVLKAFLQNFIELTKDDVIYLNNLTQTCAICQQTNPNSNIRPPPSPTHQIHGHLPAQDWQADFTHMPL